MLVGRIMVVADAPATGAEVAFALWGAGHEVVAAPASQAAAAEGAFVPGGLDLVLLDVRGAAARRFAEAYRRAPAPRPPVLAYTARVAGGARTLEAGALVREPADLDALLPEDRTGSPARIAA
jgi:DNA-binding response OmpR family regulator